MASMSFAPGLAKRSMNSAETVRNYKALSDVERAFRSLKTVDLKVRPIHHRLENRVRAHIFLCMLAYYVEWHMREAWRELMFADEDQAAKATRDPVAPARRSAAAEKKIRTRRARRRYDRSTASAHSSTNSPPSCATPVAFRAVHRRHRHSQCSPHQTPYSFALAS